MSDSDEQPQEQTSNTPHNTSAGGSHSRPVTPTLKHKGGSPWNITKSDLRRGTSYPSPLALSNNDSNSLNNSSMRKRIVLNNAPFKWELNIPNDTNRNCQIPIHSKGTINQVKA